jgi:hypothetical protein
LENLLGIGKRFLPYPFILPKQNRFHLLSTEMAKLADCIGGKGENLRTGYERCREDWA